MRILYLEPFLIRTESHFIEQALAVERLLSNNRAVDHYIVGHQQVTPPVKAVLPDVLPLLSQTCFEAPEDGGEAFFRDLCALDAAFHFGESDRILVATAYENEILGAGRFAGHKGGQCPTMALVFHQLFPPVTDSDAVRDPRFRMFWQDRLARAFRSARQEKVTYWTTESTRLNRRFDKLSGTKVGMVPVPFVVHNALPDSEPTRRSAAPRVGFLGHTRKEKGPLSVLKTVQACQERAVPVEFVLQMMTPRGFSRAQLAEFHDLLGTVKALTQVELFEGPIPPARYQHILQSLDVVLLPYDPINYCRRISGLLVHAAVHGKPVIVSSGTWGAEAVRSGLASGLVFHYVRSDEVATTGNVVRALEEFAGSASNLAAQAVSLVQEVRSHNSPQGYLAALLGPEGAALLRTGSKKAVQSQTTAPDGNPPAKTGPAPSPR